MTIDATPEEIAEKIAEQIVRISQGERDITGEDMLTVRGRVFVTMVDTHGEDFFVDDDSDGAGMVAFGQRLREGLASRIAEVIRAERGRAVMVTTT